MALLKFSVPNVNEPAELDAASAIDAVIVPLFDNPKVTLFELAKLTVPVFCELAPAEIAAPPPAATEAVMIPPADVPNVTLLALEKFSVWKVNDPAELLTA